jgi:hypothetical protein
MEKSLLEKGKRVVLEIEYAMQLRMASPSLTTEQCFEIAKDMHGSAIKYLEENATMKSEIAVGDIVTCIDNVVVDEGYDGCKYLEVGKEYKVLRKWDNGMIIVDDAINGQIDSPFYPNRFKKVAQTTRSSEVGA